jgi:hypothetical protein
VQILNCVLFSLFLAFGAWGDDDSGRLPRFEDYPVTNVFAGSVAPLKLTTNLARLYRTRIREGVERGWGVHRNGNEQVRPGPNFAGNMIVVQWSSGAPGLQMAMVDAETGHIYCPPISYHGVGAASFDLPLLTVGLSVSRNPKIQFQSDSRLFVIEATPKQTQQHPSYRYYFLWREHRWTLLKQVLLKAE